MSVDVKAFVSLYASLDAKFMRLWNPLALKTAQEVKKLLDAKDYAGAEAYANSLNLSSIADKLKPYMRFHTFAAMYYGASRLNGSAKESSIKYYADLEIVDRVVGVLHASVAYNVTKQVRKKLLDIIQANATGTVQKAEGMLEDFVSFDDTGTKMLQLVSQLHTSRLSAYGYTVEADMLGVTEYAISEQLDNRICPICAEAHGKTFQVEAARKALDTILYLEDPEDLKSTQSWPSQSKRGVSDFKEMSNEELIARNWHIPPFHPRCRGILVAKDAVPRIEDTPSYQAAMGLADKSFVLNPAVANRMNMGMTAERLNYWNEKVAYDPRKILIGLSGLTAMEISNAIIDESLSVGLAGNRVVGGITGDIAATGVQGKLYFEFNPINRTLTFTDVVADTPEEVKLALRGVVPMLIDMGAFEVVLPTEIADYLNLSSPISIDSFITALK